MEHVNEQTASERGKTTPTEDVHQSGRETVLAPRCAVVLHDAVSELEMSRGSHYTKISVCYCGCLQISHMHMQAAVLGTT